MHMQELAISATGRSRSAELLTGQSTKLRTGQRLLLSYGRALFVVIRCAVRNLYMEQHTDMKFCVKLGGKTSPKYIKCYKQLRE
jgi:hypothetical protein